MSLALSMGLASCGDFLDRPAEDSENTGTFYKNDTQCIQGVNYLYNSPWYDFQRGFINVGEVLSGNYYWGGSPYLNFSVNGTDEYLINMSYSCLLSPSDAADEEDSDDRGVAVVFDK